MTPIKVPFIITGAPRSGNHWLQYIVEQLSLAPCPIPHNIRDNCRYSFDKLFLIIRNPKECIPRHHGSGNQKNTEYVLTNINRFLDRHFSDDQKYIGSVVFPIRTFLNYPTEKLLVYYEDLITKPQSEIKRIANFVGQSANVKHFLDRYSEHKNFSLHKYKEDQGYSATFGNPKSIHCHSSILGENVTKEINNRIHNLDAEILKFLVRYV